MQHPETDHGTHCQPVLWICIAAVNAKMQISREVLWLLGREENIAGINVVAKDKERNGKDEKARVGPVLHLQIIEDLGRLHPRIRNVMEDHENSAVLHLIPNIRSSQEENGESVVGQHLIVIL